MFSSGLAIAAAYWHGVFYFLFGAISAIVCVRFFHFITRKPDTNGPVRFYINIFFLDRRELVRNIIRQKISRSRPVIRALAKRAAVALLKDGISEKVGSSLCSMLPETLLTSGIIGEANVVYLHKSFVCIELNLVDVDLPKMIAVNASEEAGEKVRYIMDYVLVPSINEYLISMLLKFLRGNLVKKLASEIRFKLWAKMNAEVEAVACLEEDLGPLLVQTIPQLEISAKSAASELQKQMMKKDSHSSKSAGKRGSVGASAASDGADKQSTPVKAVPTATTANSKTSSPPAGVANNGVVKADVDVTVTVLVDGKGESFGSGL